jgi:hypothetical protein
VSEEPDEAGDGEPGEAGDGEPGEAGDAAGLLTGPMPDELVV